MAAIVWLPGTLINPAVVDSLMSSAPNPGDSERYFQCADRMMTAISVGPQEEPGPMYPEEIMPSSSFLQDHSFHEEADREDKRPRHLRKGRMQEKCGEGWRNMDEEPGPSQPKRMCPSRGSLERREVRERTEDSESRRVRYVREASSSVASNIVEDVRNAKAVVDKYFSKVTRCLRFSSDSQL